MIAAGIVTYNPNLEQLKKNYSKYIDEVETLYIYDNASKNVGLIEDLVKDIKKVKLIKGNNNEGIAHALNCIMDTAKKDGVDWVLTMDQDSECQDNIITALKPYCSDTIGIIGSCVIEKGGTRNDYLYKNETEYVDFHITSASLTNVGIWENVGGFDEWMFIDCVDYDFCFKIREAGFKILKVNNVLLFQEIGQLKEIIIGKRHIYVRNHSPFRKYFYARNVLYCNYCHPKICRSGKQHLIKSLVILYIKVLFFESNKWEKIKAMNYGIRDARKKINELKKYKRNKLRNERCKKKDKEI